MLKKGFSCLFGIIYLFVFSSAATSEGSAVDEEIVKLEKELHELRIKTMQEEIYSQPLMFEEWKEYANHMKQAENYEEQAHEIEKKINILKAKRNDLQKSDTR